MKRLRTWQKAVLGLVIAAGILLCLFPIVALIGFGVVTAQPYRYEDTSTSPGGDYTVSVWRSDGQWSFGPARAKVVASSGGAKEIYETKIADDGRTGWANVTWLDDTTAQVELDGSEQEPEVVIVEFSGETIHLSILEELPPDAAITTIAP